MLDGQVSPFLEVVVPFVIRRQEGELTDEISEKELQRGVGVIVVTCAAVLEGPCGTRSETKVLIADPLLISAMNVSRNVLGLLLPKVVYANSLVMPVLGTVTSRQGRLDITNVVVHNRVDLAIGPN